MDADLKFYFIFLIKICLSFAYQKLLHKANRNIGFDNLYSYTGFIAEYQRHGVYDCIATCSDELKCLSLFYNHQLNRCSLHSYAFWNSVPSEYQPGWRFYIAQDVSGRCPWSEGLWYYRPLDLCYSIHQKQRMDYQVEVKPVCAAKGHELIRIDSEEKNKYIIDALGNNLSSGAFICIQGTNQLTGNSSVWTYDDMTPMTYQNWDVPSGQPSNVEQDGAIAIKITGQSGTWHNVNEMQFDSCFVVCEKRI